MPLTMADIGTQLLIKKINGRDDTKRFLESLGFVTGSQVMVISKFGGNFIVNVKDTRVAIDESMAKRILFKGDEIMRTLKSATIGETVKVLKFNGEGATKRRLMDMGITKGTSIYVRKVAPLGDPIEVTVRGYELSLRKSDAENILID